jgi:hypothetical protein
VPRNFGLDLSGRRAFPSQFGALRSALVTDYARQRARKAVWVEGDQDSGWLTAANPGASLRRLTTFDLSLSRDGDGVLLSYEAADGSLSGDTWHSTEAEAKQVAQSDFGVTEQEWGRA